MIDFVKSFEFASAIALFVYWLPLAICAGVYFFRCVALYKSDLAKSKEKYYTPELTVGLIVWFALCSICPAGNLLALTFDCAGSVFRWLGKVLDIPLVPKQKGV